jgi:hypothetical protein
MSTTKKITEEERAATMAALEQKYGTQQEDWDGFIVAIKGNEHFYAVKAPSNSVWKSFRKNLGTKGADPASLELDLVTDCLIADVPGCTSFELFKEHLNAKPLLSTKLSELVAECAKSGFQELKKG